jgi:protein phosphatase
MSQQTDQKTTPPIENLISKHFAPSPPPVAVEIAASTHPGKKRPNNEDHHLVVRRRRSRTVLASNLPDGSLPPSNEDAYVMSIADGMGGEAFGELASKMALRTGWDLGLSEVKWTLKVGRQEVKELKEKAELYFHLIDKALIQQSRIKPETAGMGTTLTIAYTIGGDAFIFHVGDSRAYLIRDGEMSRLTRDHTVAQGLVDAGHITPESVAANSFRNVLTNCIGCSKMGVSVDMSHVQLSDGDFLLLCSDGLTDMVEEDAIARAVRSGTDVEDACHELIELALEGGGKDNITVVLARYRIGD